MLSQREQELIRLYAAGQSHKGAARALGLSVHTVKDYATSIRLKLHAATMTQAAVNAMRQGLL